MHLISQANIRSDLLKNLTSKFHITDTKNYTLPAKANVLLWHSACEVWVLFTNDLSYVIQNRCWN